MSRFDSDTFRTNTLTVVGAIGYLVAFAISVATTLAGDPIPVKAISVILLASAGCLGTDFALDFLPLQISTRPEDAEPPKEK